MQINIPTPSLEQVTTAAALVNAVSVVLAAVAVIGTVAKGFSVTCKNKKQT